MPGDGKNLTRGCGIGRMAGAVALEWNIPVGGDAGIQSTK